MAKKLTLQDRIKAVQQYFRGLDIKETLFIVRIVYPSKWTAYNREDEVIKVAKAEGRNNEWYYYAETNEVDIEDIFDLIDDTIKTNEAVYQKIELMKVKMEELKDLFQSESLERLQTLEFVFNDSKRSKRKKQVKIEKPSQEAKESITEPLNEVSETSLPQGAMSITDLEELEEGWV